ncbi:peptidoglycan-binding domain-containing protein [Oscillatoria acuminata]|uniref:Putative peptidoglycan-binding domain-containing protein n=1 Tax=Oscillatoria acuminata PCC 6304 TaxID=56110 RepID=K9TK45_9CYAN|nr:peptidoglycan-binding protein [Oscillatoria acuminata]AFY82910.1 putative peptidoglycan-binding domain-containing protein [Oscillatoria acuminata PCC 6304]
MENLAYLQTVLALESVEAIRESPLHFGFNVKNCVSSDHSRLTIALSLSLFSLMQGPVASHVIPSNGLGRGDSGPLVTCVQQMLKATGYFHGPVSGFYGPMTEQAVLTWELESAGVGDGAINALTIAQIGCYQGQIPRTPRPASPNPNVTPGTDDRPIYDHDSGALRRGDRGEQVVQLQQELIAAGYFKGPVTGYYGALTEDAVMHLQQDYHIPINGVASTRTRLKLAKTPDPVTLSGETLRRGSQGSGVVSLQANLRNLGYYTGPISGYYGQLTEEAVIALQRDRRIPADGIAGPQTQSILVALY